MRMGRLKIIASCFVFCAVIMTDAQYVDDLDYNHLGFYDDLTINYPQNFEEERGNTAQDDFYILSDFEDEQNKNGDYADTNIPVLDNSELFGETKPHAEQFNWYKLPKKVYRYTKHRIPGYDYDELDYVGAKNFPRCDDKSVWTHCLCQFTCSKPDMVDCYTPCSNGCECKENFVFDEKSQQCLLPEHCPLMEERNVYE